MKKILILSLLQISTHPKEVRALNGDLRNNVSPIVRAVPIIAPQEEVGGLSRDKGEILTYSDFERCFYIIAFGINAMKAITNSNPEYQRTSLFVLSIVIGALVAFDKIMKQFDLGCAINKIGGRDRTVYFTSDRLPNIKVLDFFGAARDEREVYFKCQADVNEVLLEKAVQQMMRYFIPHFLGVYPGPIENLVFMLKLASIISQITFEPGIIRLQIQSRDNVEYFNIADLYQTLSSIMAMIGIPLMLLWGLIGVLYSIFKY